MAELFCSHGLSDSDGDVNGGADHRVVAHTDQAHHFDVGGNAGRTGELSVGVHASHGVGHTIAGGTGGHVIGMEGTAGAAAGSDGEEGLTLFDAFFLIGSHDGVLEAGGVGGVTGDGNT